jgi:hypothetical protein
MAPFWGTTGHLTVRCADNAAMYSIRLVESGAAELIGGGDGPWCAPSKR